MSTADASAGELALLGPGLLRRAARRTPFRWPHTRPWRVAMWFAVGTWLPLALFAELEHHLTGPGGSLLRDVGPHVRLLWIGPLLIGFAGHAESEVARAAASWREGDLLPPAERERFERFAARIAGLQQSVLLDAALVALAFGLSWLGVEGARPGAAAWEFADHARALSWAGRWYALLCVPLFNLLVLRWMARYVIWTALLLRMATLPPRVRGTHADGVGGLDTLERCQHLFLPLALAIASIEAAGMANLIAHHGATFSGLKATALAAAAVSLIVFLAPLLVFTPQLVVVRRHTNQRYGAVAARHAAELEGAIDRALDAKPPARDRLHSALLERDANLVQSFAIVRTMRVVLVSRSSLLLWVLATVGPPSLLVLTEVPAAQLLRRVRELLL